MICQVFSRRDFMLRGLGTLASRLFPKQARIQKPVEEYAFAWKGKTVCWSFEAARIAEIENYKAVIAQLERIVEKQREERLLLWEKFLCLAPVKERVWEKYPLEARFRLSTEILRRFIADWQKIQDAYSS
jgi:hypothetical protein